MKNNRSYKATRKSGGTAWTGVALAANGRRTVGHGEDPVTAIEAADGKLDEQMHEAGEDDTPSTPPESTSERQSEEQGSLN